MNIAHTQWLCLWDRSPFCFFTMYFNAASQIQTWQATLEKLIRSPYNFTTRNSTPCTHSCSPPCLHTRGLHGQCKPRPLSTKAKSCSTSFQLTYSIFGLIYELHDTERSFSASYHTEEQEFLYFPIQSTHKWLHRADKALHRLRVKISNVSHHFLPIT